jgi:tetratricopeptide (TPR) repeat protein
VRLFRAVTVVLAPVVVLGGLELVLRLFGVGLHWNHAILLDNRDVFLVRRGEPDRGRAIPEYLRVLEAFPRYGEAHIRLAEAYARLGRLDEAEAQCREVLRFRPGDVQARATLAYVASRRGRAPH